MRCLKKSGRANALIKATLSRLSQLPLEELGALADRRRRLARGSAYDGQGNGIVTYIVDRNLNYTNVCNVYCKFSRLYRTETVAAAAPPSSIALRFKVTIPL